MNDELEPGIGDADPGEAGPRSEETVGEMLLAARERAGVGLEEIGQDTKIPVPTLRYLETDNFEAIPARVYAKGFLRTYAAALGLDVQQVLNKYEVQTGQTHRSRGDLWEIEEQTVEEQLPRTRLLSRLILPAVLLVIIVAVLVKVFGGSDETRPPPDRSDTIPASGERSSEPAGDGAAGSDGEGALPVRERRPPAVPAGREAESSAADRSVPAVMQLRLVATDRDTTWLDVIVYTRTETGLDSIPDDFILYPGGVKTLRSNDSFLLRTIGNAGGFRLELDGRVLPPLGERGRVLKNVRITRTGIAGG